MKNILEEERRRILAEYARRGRELPREFYSPARPHNLFATQQRARHALRALSRAGLLPLQCRRALEIGCGAGGILPELESWGVARGNLAGIDINASRVTACSRLLAAYRGRDGRLLSPGAMIVHGDASALPWASGTFDLVVLSLVMTSILDDAMRTAVALESLRVLAPRGCILWYDFAFDNPRNAHVRAVKRSDLKRLFPDCDYSLSRVTLAPPVSRRLVARSWLAAVLLESTTLLNTHLLGTIRPRTTGL